MNMEFDSAELTKIVLAMSDGSTPEKLNQMFQELAMKKTPKMPMKKSGKKRDC